MLFFQMGITTTPNLTEFCTSLELLRARGVTVLADVTFSAMWTAQRSKVLRLTSQRLQLQRQQRELIVSVAPKSFSCLCCCGPQTAMRQQGLINCLCPESIYWLQTG
jgi:hypothetical protein